MIALHGLRKSFGHQLVLDGIDLHIGTGEMVAIVGPSGTGKSVLLKLITGLMPADEGEVVVGTEVINALSSEHQRLKLATRMGVLFQAAALFDSMSLFDNVAFPLRIRKELGEAQIAKRVLRFLDEVGLRGHENDFPGHVSIGMRKRVGIARALVTEPEVILFDEPNTGLDPAMGQEIYELINETHAHFHFTGIVVSHEIPEVFQVCRRVAMLYQGRVQADGTIEEFLNSSNPVVKQFVDGRTQGPIELG